MIRIFTLMSVFVCVQCLRTTTSSPEGSTDIPEEIERGEDVTTNNSSIPTTPFANDPMEQNDFYNPTRKPPAGKIQNTARQSKAIKSTTKKTTEKVVTEAEERVQSTTIEAEEMEPEEATVRQVYSYVTSAPEVYPTYSFFTTVPDYSWIWWLSKK